MAKYNLIGIMSGTSLDGVDIASCRFTELNGIWEYSIDRAETIKYSNTWKERLKKQKEISAIDLVQLHTEYGRLLGNMAKKFIEKYSLAPDFIASHGHTLFHQPSKQFTFQIGSGAEIAAVTEKKVICDFRTTDVALGGQGAPLVPIGDELLFGEYDYCLNLGGFANISYKEGNKRIAFDICPVNIMLNQLSNKLGHEFDKDGLLAASGNIDKTLLDKLNRLDYYSNKPPKSLGAEWLEEQFLPLMVASPPSIPDQLRTVVEHIAQQIVASVNTKPKARILITGGGAFNRFLINQIRKKAGCLQTIIPEENIVNYKEALIFAFLGLLRMIERPNCIKSVTGASIDNIGGAVYLGKNTE